MGFVNTVDVLGDDVVADSILEGTITEFRDDTITKIGSGKLAECHKLILVDTPNVTLIMPAAFQWSSSFKTLILRKNAVCTLETISSLQGTKIESKSGYVYVPAALKAQYMQATNWSTYASQFRALEDYTVDGTIWGDLDPNKI